jgi:hypothetical protein
MKVPAEFDGSAGTRVHTVRGGGFALAAFAEVLGCAWTVIVR